MKIVSLLIASFITLTSLSCTVYRSPERKEFESESPQFRVQNLKVAGCSEVSVKSKSLASRLVTVLQDETQTSNLYLWEHIIENESHFESDNLQGEFCAYQKN